VIRTEEVDRLIKNPNALVDPQQRAHLAPAVEQSLRRGLVEGLQWAFGLGGVMAVLAWLAGWQIPSGALVPPARDVAAPRPSGAMMEGQRLRGGRAEGA